MPASAKCCLWRRWIWIGSNSSTTIMDISEGDFAIRSIAQAISDTAVEVDGICARFGGDEYVMCLVEEYDKANLTFYEKYRQMLQERIAAD